MRTLLVLSPHLDDAALSCGGRIAHAIDAGRPVLVATFFTQDEPREPPSQLAADLRRWWKLPPGEVMRCRREEDLEACRRLGAEPLHLDLPEAPYRMDDRGAILYPELKSLFGAPAEADLAWRERLARTIADLAARAGDGAELLAPLGVGGHVDHILVRSAAELAGCQLGYFEEFPYVAWKWLSLGRALRALGGRSAWLAESIAVSPDQFERKVAGIMAYGSQVPAMFHTEARLRKQLRRQHRKAGGERVWHRRATPSGPR